MTASSVSVVAAWHEALNAGDIDRLIELSSEDVEMGGPRGTATGAGVLRDWAIKTGIRLEPRRVFRRGDTLVVEETARWLANEGEGATGGKDVATVFVVRDGRVGRVMRHANLAAALGAAGLDISDESHEG